MEQQFDASKIGMWLFLATEVLLFGGLFVGFAMMQSRYPQDFFEAHHHLDKNLGFLNTVVLLISSFTMVMAVLSSSRSQKNKTVIYLLLTILCACIFLGVKYVEYSAKIEHGLLPGNLFTNHEAPPGSHQFVFFSFYFMMTGLHGFHILCGIIALSWITWRAHKGEFSAAYNTPVDLVGLYWHLVDLIWIYLFPLLYLIT
ncbi:MAG: cytochrome c oxidase subunit 3 family protein [Bryobacteraceae bacterium]